MTLINVISGLYTNVKLYGAKGDGITDDTSAIANAITAVNSGGTVIFPPGTYITQTQSLVSKVHLLGAGYESTILQLKAGTNADLLAGDIGAINLSASNGSSSTLGVEQFSIQHMTLDGNKANQSSGTSYPIRFYGYAFLLNCLRIRNGYTGGVLIDWNGGTSAPDAVTLNDIEGQITNFVIHDCNGLGLEMGGPHDSQIANGLIYNTGTTGLHFAPNAQAIQTSQVHVYSVTHSVNAVAYLVEGGSCCFTNCEAEGSDNVQVALIANGCIWKGGRIFSASLSCSGVQFGQQAGNTPYAGMINQSAGTTTAVSVSGCDVDTNINACEGSNGSIWMANDGGTGNNVIADVFNSTGTYITGTRAAGTNVAIFGRGLTADGTLGKSGGTLLNGASMRSGTFASTRSSSVATISNNSTITTLGVGYARVTETGAVTGIILQAGSFDGQQVWVVNEANFTITFAAAGTSHVADGVTSAIPGLAARLFVYDTGQALWYRAA